MMESVSAVDGSNISGVIEEVGTNCALRSDRHLLSRRSPCPKCYRKLGILFLCSLYQTAYVCADYPVIG